MDGSTIYYGWEKAVPQFHKIGELNDPHADYSFYTFFVFQHVPTGRVYWNTDSGCSCPSPFENETWYGPDETTFNEVRPENLDEFVRNLWEFLAGESSLQDEKREIERAVRQLVVRQ